MATTEQRLAEYEEAYKKAQAYNPTQFQSEFEKAYGEATNYNKDLIEQQAKALGEVQAVAPTLRQRYMNTLITDPTAQMALIAQARQAPITSYGTAANLLAARGQRYQDILGKALGGYQTAAEQANTAAENAWRLYQDAVQQEQARRAAARSSGLNIADLLSAMYSGGSTGPTTGEIYEIPEGGIPIKDGKIDLQQAGNTWTNRLANEVLKQREANGVKDVLKAYSQSTLEPYKNIKNIGDIISIPTRMGGVYTTIASDLFSRLFKK